MRFKRKEKKKKKKKKKKEERIPITSPRAVNNGRT